MSGLAKAPFTREVYVIDRARADLIAVDPGTVVDHPVGALPSSAFNGLTFR